MWGILYLITVVHYFSINCWVEPQRRPLNDFGVLSVGGVKHCWFAHEPTLWQLPLSWLSRILNYSVAVWRSLWICRHFIMCARVWKCVYSNSVQVSPRYVCFNNSTCNFFIHSCVWLCGRERHSACSSRKFMLWVWSTLARQRCFILIALHTHSGWSGD